MSTIRATNFQHASAAAPAIVLAANGSATANVSSINNGPLAGMRNAIINGNFDIWQRGTSQTTAGYGSADRWSTNTGSATFSLSRQSFTIGQTNVPSNPAYFARYQITVAPSTSNTNMRQLIEDVSSFAGQQITVSFWAKADAAKSIWVGHFQNFGTGGSPSETVNTTGQIITLSTSWTRYSVTTTLPSVSGKTLGSDNNSSLSLHFIISNTQTGFDWSPIPAQTITFDIAQVQAEPGPVATPFERRPIGTELALCQRYYEVVAAYVIADASVGGQSIGYGISFAVAKRVTPSLAEANLTESVNVGAINIENVNTGGFRYRCVTNASGAVIRSANVNASAEL